MPPKDSSIPTSPQKSCTPTHSWHLTGYATLQRILLNHLPAADPCETTPEYAPGHCERQKCKTAAQQNKTKPKKLQAVWRCEKQGDPCAMTQQLAWSADSTPPMLPAAGPDASNAHTLLDHHQMSAQGSVTQESLLLCGPVNGCSSREKHVQPALALHTNTQGRQHNKGSTTRHGQIDSGFVL